MTIEHSDAYYDYKRNDPDRENPFTDPKDRARAERVVSGISKMNVDTEKYLDFVKGVTSNESLDYAALLSRTNKLEIEDDCNVPQLLTAALGLTAEAGEFTEVVKKIIFFTISVNSPDSAVKPSAAVNKRGISASHSTSKSVIRESSAGRSVLGLLVTPATKSRYFSVSTFILLIPDTTLSALALSFGSVKGFSLSGSFLL